VACFLPRSQEAGLAAVRGVGCGPQAHNHSPSATGLADPVSGEGITWAVRSGQLAAEAIAAHAARPEAACAAYSASLAREILPELRLATLLVRLLYCCPRLRQAAFRRAGLSTCRAPSDVFAGKETYRTLLLRAENLRRLAIRLVGRKRFAR
jgi:flavin-dependent dehydrogenase